MMRVSSFASDSVDITKAVRMAYVINNYERSLEMTAERLKKNHEG